MSQHVYLVVIETPSYWEDRDDREVLIAADLVGTDTKIVSLEFYA